MAETCGPPNQNGHLTASPLPDAAGLTGTPQKRGPSIHQIYALPAPIRTFPLPVFYPNNPLSILAFAYAWFRQTVAPPPAEPAVVHHGSWSAATSSVHITDEKSMRALWEQGFYGKGNLSRSEPNWLKREQVRRGLQETHVSEIFTNQRRDDRAQAKWERARLEQEAIRQTRLEEARQVKTNRHAMLATLLPPASPATAPVGPLELLSLPNSNRDRNFAALESQPDATVIGLRASVGAVAVQLQADIVPETLDLTNHIAATTADIAHIANSPAGVGLGMGGKAPDSASDSTIDSTEEKSGKRQKSVRFSPKVESTTFKFSDPPSPNHGNGLGKDLSVNGSASNGKPFAEDGAATPPIVNKEHLQLTREEAFFLVFALGALAIKDPVTGVVMTTRQLLHLFRQFSYFPPRIEADEPDLQPEDGFLVHYAVYHHFRSLGWVPRPGIKFGVDWLLYTRGPVFDHAEFGLIVLPSYSDPWWKAAGRTAPDKTWAWMHSVVRVLSHVTKSLVLVYVEVPPPPKFHSALAKGYVHALELYQVREIMVKRWSSNRNR